MPRRFLVLVFGLIAMVGCSRSAPSSISRPQPAAPQAAPAAPSAASPIRSVVANADPVKPSIVACALLTSKEIESVQREPLKEAKPSSRPEGGFTVSQCFFTLPTFTNSISLVVTERGEYSGARDPKQFWKETFHREKGSENERDRDKDRKRDKDRDKASGREREEEEEGTPPQQVTGVGDEAFWTGNRVGGALYALKGHTYIRVSVGGPGDQTTKIKKSKALAQMILKRL